MKGLILCAGKGTRLQPFSYSQPKTLLPVAGKSVLEYCLQNLIKQGIKEIGIVVNPSQDSIFKAVGNGERFGVKLHYIYQLEQKGISHAVKAAEEFIGRDPFVLLLGDNLIAEDLETLIESYQRDQTSGAVMLSQVSNPQDYGIAVIKGNEIVDLEEKPAKPKSNLAVIGAYLFDHSIFKAVHSIRPSKRGEYEITDAIQWLIENGFKISYTITKKLYSDVGTIGRWLEANEWMLSKRLEKKVVIGNNTIIENCTLRGPVIIGDNCVLKDAEIGPFVSIQDHCYVENCHIDHSILLEKSNLSHIEMPVSQSVFGREVNLKGLTGATKNKVQFYVGDKAQLIIPKDGEDPDE